MRKLLIRKHYGTACVRSDHASQKARIALAFPSLESRMLVTPSYFKTARVPASGEETMSSRERRVDTRVNIRVPLRFRSLTNPGATEQLAESENISQRGVYF